MLWKKMRLLAFMVMFVTITVAGPSGAFSDGLPVRQPPAGAGHVFTVPLDRAEQELAGDPSARASLRHAKAVKLRFEYLRTGDLKKLYRALNTCGEAIGLDASQSRYWVTLGNIHTEMARFNIFRAQEYARDSFRQALDLDPENAAVMVLLAVNLAKTGRYEEALTYFEKAVETDILTLSADIVRWMNVCYLVDGHTQRGVFFYQTVQNIYPHYYYLSYYQAILSRAHFDYDSARRKLTELLGRRDLDEETRDAAHRLRAELDGEGGADS